MTTTQQILAACDLRKSFGGVAALKGVTVSFNRGDITALIGDNGAGKSTLVKCLAGLHQPDSGQITVEGRAVTIGDPRRARTLGIETVYQDLGLVDELTVTENLFLSREPQRGLPFLKLLDKRAMRRQAREMLAQIGAADRIPTDGVIGWMSGGQRQAVAICRAVTWGAKVIILDEPTAALGVTESDEVHQLIRRLKSQGITVIFVSHNFEEIMALADYMWVMRQGVAVAGRQASETNGTELVSLLTGATSTTN
jgi:ABC-type sugar transport system ATPase subunit